MSIRWRKLYHWSHKFSPVRVLSSEIDIEDLLLLCNKMFSYYLRYYVHTIYFLVYRICELFSECFQWLLSLMYNNTTIATFSMCFRTMRVRFLVF